MSRPCPPTRLAGRRRSPVWAAGLLATAAVAPALAQQPAQNLPAPNAVVLPGLTLETLPRPTMPPSERGPVVPAQVERWRQEARALEYGEGAERDPVRAAQLYCRASRYGDAEAQYSLAWMLTNARGIERDDAQAAHLFSAAAEQGHPQAQAMAARLGTPLGAPPPCLNPPDGDLLPLAAAPQPARVLVPRPGVRPAPFPPVATLPPPPPPPGAPPQIVRFVQLVAPEYQLEPHVVLAVMAQESNFDPLALSPKNAQGLMQLIPDTARRFNVRNAGDPAQNIRGGMAYLRWLLAFFEGDLTLTLAAYNAGERAVERYRGVPPYAETRLYVRKIIASLNGQRSHPFDARITPPSDMLTLLRGATRRN
ncbi:MAG: transglycosylase SLT domain-containing protein [Rubrivivax sp.]|nr:transglycosylase SLT domain-containing protein [Rubrivivax sp.]MBK7260809.1 transglycosylase SLT domain-containing protein [Rubrivivax sp.]MBK8526485.1 transglycosylase SLT domain-containing protein [Rubrivivax sp.]